METWIIFSSNILKRQSNYIPINQGEVPRLHGAHHRPPPAHDHGLRPHPCSLRRPGVRVWSALRAALQGVRGDFQEVFHKKVLLATGCWQSWLPRPEKQVRRGCWRLRGQLTSGGHLNSCLTNLGSYICWTNFLAKLSLLQPYQCSCANRKQQNKTLKGVYEEKKHKVSVLQKKWL